MRGRPDEVRALFQAVVQADGYQVEQALPRILGRPAWIKWTPTSARCRVTASRRSG
jgi:hypothetical protein